MILREIDQRKPAARAAADGEADRLTEQAATVSADRLGGDHEIAIDRFDEGSGTADVVESSGAPAETDDYVDRALAHVQQITPALGLVEDPDSQPVEFVVDPDYQRTSSDGVTVQLQPTYRGRKIFQASQTVQFDPEGRIQRVINRSTRLPATGEPVAQIPATEAVRRAAEYTATQQDAEGRTDQFGEPVETVPIDLDGFDPETLATFPDIHEQPTVFESGPFGGPITARQLWFPVAPDDVRLAWDVELTMPDGIHQYVVMVDAADGAILYVRPLTQSTAAKGNVFPVDGDDDRELRSFPLAPAAYPVDATDLPDGFPEWVEDRATDGINAIVRTERSPGWIFGSPEDPLEGEFDGEKVVFDPEAEFGEQQGLLNAFYFTNVMHDLFYLLGFREADGNFQRHNFDRGGVQSDSVDVRYVPGAVDGVATMGTPVDGHRPRMHLGLVRRTGRHTALDSSVVYHEYTHGVTNRIVGGAMNTRALLEPQSRGQGEGWSDYVACTLDETTVVGDWVVDDPSGIRDHAYDESFPGRFDDLGSEGYTDPHDVGTVWCGTLMQLNRELGRATTMQLVVDALKLTPPNPSMLDSRDAILTEVDNRRRAGQYDEEEAAEVTATIERTFAVFGMGPDAVSAGPSLEGIRADYAVEPGIQPAPGEPAEPAGEATEAETPTAGGPITAETAVPSTVVAMAPTPTSDGFYLVDGDGQVFTFGDAAFHGSLDAPPGADVVDIEATRSGDGYWVVLADGEVHAFGDASEFEAPLPDVPHEAEQ